MAKSKVKKAVIPAAGFGTRFLPQTKAMPKEMLPVVDKPIIQYVVEEAVEAGIEDIIMITGWHKRAVEDHFDYPFELEVRLEEWGKEKELKEVRRIAGMANFIYVRQKGPYGNATPVMCAEKIIGNEPFLVLWGDEFVQAKPSRVRQLIRVYEYYQGSVMGCIRTSKAEDTYRYGYIDGDQVEKNVYQVDRVIEKPGPEKTPSDLAAVANYLLTPTIFPILKKLKPGKGGELWLPEAIGQLLKVEPVYARVIENGQYYDTGNKLEYLKTVVEFGLKHKETGKEFKKYLKSLKI